MSHSDYKGVAPFTTTSTSESRATTTNRRSPPCQAEIMAALEESISSMDLHALETDPVVPPETTKPEPLDQPGKHSVGWSNHNKNSSGDVEGDNKVGIKTSLASIMQEQERDRQSRMVMATMAHSQSVSLEDEEAALLRFAMERSMADCATGNAVGVDNGAMNLSAKNGEAFADWRNTGGGLSAAERDEIERALADSKLPFEAIAGRASANANDILNELSAEDAAAIQAALMEAKLEDERQQELEQQSLLLALQMEREEMLDATNNNNSRSQQQQGNVRVMTRHELEAEGRRVGAYSSSSPAPRHPLEAEGAEPYDDAVINAGFRMNTVDPQEYSRRGDLVLGPDNELLTKHDTTLNAMANAHRLGLEDVNNIGNKAFNSFRASVKRNKVKGVAAHGTGRAGSDATSNGVIDPQVRLVIGKAINNGMIERCHGIVKEGKEAVVCHASMGEGEQFDVAVKVFKRITEFKGRADYVQGDARYARENFRKLGAREQLNMWAEKEYRNLVRANRAGVPVPTPLAQNENVLFMRFFGTEGWPAPQLRELNLRRASKRWDILYNQVMMAIRNLFQKAKLVHGDLSEYNIMVVPAYLVENADASLEDPDQDLQATLIDFGQAVEWRHPEATTLLERDIARVGKFFSVQGVQVMDESAAFVFVTEIVKDDQQETLDDESEDWQAEDANVEQEHHHAVPSENGFTVDGGSDRS